MTFVFVSKEELRERCGSVTGSELVEIPEGADYMRLKSNYIYFFNGKPPKEDGYSRIEKEVKGVCFPDYEPHMYNIHYGTPKFVKETV